MGHKNDLTTAPVRTLIGRIAAPASVGYFFNTMYNVVDTFYGGLVSTQALAALSLSLPVFFLILALGSGLSIGSTALIATALGANKAEEAGVLSVQSLTFGALVGLGLMVLGPACSPFLFRLLGASNEYLGTALDYMNVIFTGAVFFITVFMLNAILNARGDSRTYRNFLIIGFLSNAALDPWFIYGGLGLPAMGFKGVALATVLIQVVGCFYLGRKVIKAGLIPPGALSLAMPRGAVFREIARQGFPASVNTATIGVGIFVITFFISQFGQEGVAAYGIAMRIEQIVLMPTIGLNVAVLTIVAQNHGAGLFDRIRETVNLSLKYGAVIMVFGSGAVFFLSRSFMTLFTDDASVIEIGTLYLKIDALVLYAYVVLFVNVAALQGIKKPMFAVWLGVSRQIAAPAAVFYFFAVVLDWGLPGVWWGIFLITWSAALFTFFYARNLLRKTSRG
ncbi:MAG: MATE family efflux transporter [Pseudomonadota bacterium]